MEDRIIRIFIDKEKFEKEINDLINKGKSLLEKHYVGEEGYNQLKSDDDRWTRYICTYLSKNFSDNNLIEEFQAINNKGSMYLSMVKDRQIWIKDYKEKVIQQKTNILESIIDQIQLYEYSQKDHLKKIFTKNNSREVFVVHGHDVAVKESVARFLEKLDLYPIILSEQPSKGKTIIEKFEEYSDVCFAVILLTPDDIGGVKSGEYQARARQNVIFELGYFVGKLGRGKVCLLQKDTVEIPSDLSGVIYVNFDSNEGWKNKLAMEIRSSEIEIDLNKIS